MYMKCLARAKWEEKQLFSCICADMLAVNYNNSLFTMKLLIRSRVENMKLERC